MQLVEKKRFNIPQFTFETGQTLPIEIGYESMGTLSPQKDNVILIPHAFSLSSHFAGKYKEDDPLPGYWDAIIGPGKEIDTDKFYVISTDNLADCNVKDPMIYASGPASIDPETGKPYGLSFPIPTMLDVVHTQKALLEDLGIKHLHAVIGASMGGMISYTWAVEYPDWMDRLIIIASSPKHPEATSIMTCQNALRAVALDPKWNGGDYYGGPEPTDGILLANQIMTGECLSKDYFENTFQWKSFNPACLEDLFALHDYEQQLVEWSSFGGMYVDANHWIYSCRMCINHDISRRFGGNLDEALRQIKAKVLLMPISSDGIHREVSTRRIAERINQLGGNAKLFVIDSDLGHVAANMVPQMFGPEIQAFLAN